MLDQEVFTKEVMQQYETVRKSGVCNMFDMTCVAEACDMLEFQDLLEVVEDRGKYTMLLMNFGKLMEHYEIAQ